MIHNHGKAKSLKIIFYKKCSVFRTKRRGPPISEEFSGNAKSLATIFLYDSLIECCVLIMLRTFTLHELFPFSFWRFHEHHNSMLAVKKCS